MLHRIAAAVAALTLGASALPPAALAGTITPVAGKPVLALATYDLATLGYQVDEFFLSGEATSYRPAGALGPDGRWAVEPADKAPFTTRLVVVRPANRARFNGTVLVEWLNVSAGADGAPDWSFLHRELIRSGYAYVGVSAQRVGIEGNGMNVPGAAPLKKADPVRYGPLVHPGDAFSYDIFTQAARAVRDGKVLGPLKPRRLIGDGESQSAGFLTTYINAVDPLTRAFDGYLVHSRSGSSAPLSKWAEEGGQQPRPLVVRYRDDLRVPVLTFITETDLMRANFGYLGARQPDTARLRVWEVAGTAHADTYLLSGAVMDSGAEPVAALARAFAPTTNVMGGALARPINSAPQHHYVMQAALAALDRWVRGGPAPPHGPSLAVTGPPPALTLDATGNAAGGVRSPWADAPTARLSGLGQTGPGFASLFGTSDPFDKARLADLYPGGRAQFLGRFGMALGRSVHDGFILGRDEAEIRALAAAAWPAP